MTNASALMMRCSNVFCASAMDATEFVDLAESALAALELDPSTVGQDGAGTCTSVNWPSIFEPIYQGELEKLRRILSASADVVHVDGLTGVSSLMIALSKPSNQLEVVRLLIDHGCPLEQVTTKAVVYGSLSFKSHWSALMVGCERGSPQAVEFLAALAKKSVESVECYRWNFRLWVGALLVARINARYRLAEDLQRFDTSIKCCLLPLR
jgi:hypothetical protein